MSEDDRNGSDPKPSDETPFGPGAGKSLVIRRFFEQVRRQLKELGASETPVLKIRPADYANVFAEDTDLEIGPALEAANRMLEAEGHQVTLIVDEVDNLDPDETDDEEEAKEP